jgi:hypothetical protein
MDIQGDFDGSVNIIFTDDKNNPGIINSRFKRIDSSRLVSIADRTGTKDSNIYSDDDWDRVALQNTNYPVKVVDAFGEETLRYWKGLLKRGDTVIILNIQLKKGTLLRFFMSRL